MKSSVRFFTTNIASITSPTRPMAASDCRRPRAGTPRSATRARASSAQQCRDADRAGLQPLAHEQVVRVREHRVAELALQLGAQDRLAEAEADPGPLADALERVLPEQRSAGRRRSPALPSCPARWSVLRALHGRVDEQHGRRRAGAPAGPRSIAAARARGGRASAMRQGRPATMNPRRTRPRSCGSRSRAPRRPAAARTAAETHATCTGPVP